MEQNKERGPYGQRMIKFIVRFWTDKLSEEYAHKKIAQAKGEIYLPINKNKGINKSDKILFNNLDEFLLKFRRLIEDNGIKLVDVKQQFVEVKFKNKGNKNQRYRLEQELKFLKESFEAEVISKEEFEKGKNRIEEKLKEIQSAAKEISDEYEIEK